MLRLESLTDFVTNSTYRKKSIGTLQNSTYFGVTSPKRKILVESVDIGFKLGSCSSWLWISQYTTLLCFGVTKMLSFKRKEHYTIWLVLVDDVFPWRFFNFLKRVLTCMDDIDRVKMKVFNDLKQLKLQRKKVININDQTRVQILFVITITNDCEKVNSFWRSITLTIKDK